MPHSLSSQNVEPLASLISFSAFCPWNHLNTKKAWTPNAHKENMAIRAIMSDPYRTIPIRNAHRRSLRAANPSATTAISQIATVVSTATGPSDLP